MEKKSFCKICGNNPIQNLLIPKRITTKDNKNITKWVESGEIWKCHKSIHRKRK